MVISELKKIVGDRPFLYSYKPFTDQSVIYWAQICEDNRIIGLSSNINDLTHISLIEFDDTFILIDYFQDYTQAQWEIKKLLKI